MFATELRVQARTVAMSRIKRACLAVTVSLVQDVPQQIKVQVEAPLRVKSTVGQSPKTCTLLFDWIQELHRCSETTLWVSALPVPIAKGIVVGDYTLGHTHTQTYTHQTEL